MKLSYRQAAEALGICTSAVGFYSRGTRKNTKESNKTAVDVPKTVLLACRAVELGEKPVK